ncbi:hypothetical protein LIA77_08902 [Sarocladium implicatum]|nr:hypothetical protein LIA77_08902 [Sarocladium implicatum]
MAPVLAILQASAARQLQPCLPPCQPRLADALPQCPHGVYTLQAHPLHSSRTPSKGHPVETKP